MRALIGIVQAFETPGSCSAWFICSTSCGVLSRSGVIRRRAARAHAGSQVHPEYHVVTGRHWSCGLRTITVSIMESGAGSVEVSARPDLPNTVSTSGKLLMMRFWTCINCCASVTERPGNVDGMNRRVPSSSGGMNSDPSR